MAFVFKGGVRYWDSNRGQRAPIYERTTEIRLISDTFELQLGPSTSSTELLAHDITRDDFVSFEFSYVISTSQGSQFREVELFIAETFNDFNPGNGQNDVYQFNLLGDHRDAEVGEFLRPYIEAGGFEFETINFVTRTILTLPPYGAGSLIDFRDLAELEFLGETGVSLLEGNEADREVGAKSIAYLYEAGLDRDGDIDEGGLNFWIDAAGDGFTDRQLARAFLDSPEFEAAFGAPETLTDEQYVEQLYQNVLDRASDQAGFDFWFDALEAVGGQRDVLLIAFARSNENIAGSPAVETLTETESGIWEFIA